MEPFAARQHLVGVIACERRVEALAEIDRAKTQFFANISHEFRTPLTLMLGPLEDMKRDFEGAVAPAPHYRQVDLVHRNGLRLLKLVNTLLDFSRIEAGRMQALYVATDLAQLTAHLASEFRSVIEKAGLRLVVNAPPLAEAAYVDREMWEKIVFKLLSNALKFTFEGTIEVSLRQENSNFQLAVTDTGTGTGIPADELPKRGGLDAGPGPTARIGIRLSAARRSPAERESAAGRRWPARHEQDEACGRQQPQLGEHGWRRCLSLGQIGRRQSGGRTMGTSRSICTRETADLFLALSSVSASCRIGCVSLLASRFRQSCRNLNS